MELSPTKRQQAKVEKENRKLVAQQRRADKKAQRQLDAERKMIREAMRRAY